MEKELFAEIILEQVNCSKNQRDSTLKKIAILVGLSERQTTYQIQKVFNTTLAKLLKIRHTAGILKEIPEYTKDNLDNKNIREIGIGRESYVSNNYSLKELVDYHISNRSSYKIATQDITSKLDNTVESISQYVKTIYSKSLIELLMPSYDEAVSALISSDSSEEYRNKLGLTKYAFRGFYDKYFGVSTFVKAKSKIVIKTRVAEYIPTLADNKSIIISQILGDGYYDTTRKSIKIEHGYKQLDYLIWKVSMLSLALPLCNTIVDIKKQVREAIRYESYTWYSKKLPSNYVIIIEDSARWFDNFTALGWLLWFLDDGGIYTGQVSENKFTHKLEISSPGLSPDLVSYSLKDLSKYGITAKYHNNSIIIQDKVNISKFISNIILPFDNKIPECMYYKYKEFCKHIIT